MKQRLLGVRVDRDAPADAASVNAQLLTQGSFIKKEMAGAYSYLALGLRVLRKVENIVREEMNAINGSEVQMPSLLPMHLWGNDRSRRCGYCL